MHHTLEARKVLLVQCSWFSVQGSGFKVSGLGFTVSGFGFRSNRYLGSAEGAPEPLRAVILTAGFGVRTAQEDADVHSFEHLAIPIPIAGRIRLDGAPPAAWRGRETFAENRTADGQLCPEDTAKVSAKGSSLKRRAWRILRPQKKRHSSVLKKHPNLQPER